MCAAVERRGLILHLMIAASRERLRERTTDDLYSRDGVLWFGARHWSRGRQPEWWPHRDNLLYPNGRANAGVSGNRLFNGYSLGETTAVADGLSALAADAAGSGSGSLAPERPFTLTRASWAGQ